MPSQLDFEQWLAINGPINNSAANWRIVHKFLHAYQLSSNPMFLRMIAALITDTWAADFLSHSTSFELLVSTHSLDQKHLYSKDADWLVGIGDDGALASDLPNFNDTSALIAYTRSLVS